MRAEKKGIVEELKSEIEGTNPLVFTDYKGIKVKDLTQLRFKLTQVEAKYKVVKNRLFKRALEDVDIKELPFQIEGPLAIAYGGKDVVEVVKALVQFAKDYPDNINIKGGIVDNAFLDLSGIETLAKLPPKEMLLGKIVAQIGAPISRMVMVLQGNIRKLVCALDGVIKKKS